MSAAQLDHAVTQHMAHAAMSGGDPLTDSLFDQLQAAAAEGALPATPYAAGTVTEPDHWGWWLVGGSLLAAMAGLITIFWRA